jgi:hypothetical protein
MAKYEPDKRFGFVLFDDIKDPSAGWASIGQTATRIASVDDLSTGVIWWSNIEYSVFFYSTEIWRKSFLRHDRYLVVSPDRTLAEWNHDAKRMTNDFKCIFLAQVFNRVMHAAFNLARRQIPTLTMEKLFGGQRLLDDLRVLMPEMDYPRSDAAAIMKVDQAYAEFTKCTVRTPYDGENIILRRPRLQYSAAMLQMIVPVGPFENMDRRELRKAGGDDRAQFVRESEKPFMVELTVERMDQNIGPIYGFSNASDKKKKTTRSWVAHPEFMALNQFAELDIRSAWVGDSYKNLYEELDSNIQDFFNTPINDALWTAGIISETLWRSMLVKEDGAKVGRAADGDERAGTSWEGAWIRANDKIMMFAAAKQLTDRGYAVTSYGLGWVMCKIPREMKAEYLKDALSLGLVPAMSDVPDGLFPKKNRIPWTDDQKAYFLAACQAAKRHDLLWAMDVMSVVDDPKRRAEIQKKIMQEAQERGW